MGVDRQAVDDLAGALKRMSAQEKQQIWREITIG